MELTMFDNLETVTYKYAYSLGVPVKYTYTTSDGQIDSIIRMVIEMIHENTPIEEIYKRVEKLNSSIGPKDLGLLYAHCFPAAHQDADMMRYINMFYRTVCDSVEAPPDDDEQSSHSLRIPEFRDVDEFVVQRGLWGQKFDALMNHDLEILAKINRAQADLAQQTPVVHHPPVILMITTLYKPRLLNGDLIDPEDGIEIFDAAVPSYNVPFIQYNDGNGKSYERIYHGAEEDNDVPVFSMVVQPVTQAGKPNTMYLTVWTGASGSKPTRESYIRCVYSLKDGTIKVPAPTIAGGVSEMARKVLNALPAICLDEGKEVRVRGSFNVEDVDICEPVLHFLILSDPKFSRYLYIEESTHSRAEKKRLNIHYRKFTGGKPRDDATSSGYVSKAASVSITFNAITGDDEDGGLMSLDFEEPVTGDINAPKILKVNVITAESRLVLQQFTDVFTRLLSLYNQLKEGIQKYFRFFIPESCPAISPASAIEDDGTPEVPGPMNALMVSDKKIKNLRRIAPQVFVKGYACQCQCSLQPLIIRDDEVKEWTEKTFNDGGAPTKRQVMQYPPPRGPLDNPNNEPELPKMWIVCPSDTNPYPTMKKNISLSNSKQYPYVPCCGKSNDLDRPDSGYYKFYTMRNNPQLMHVSKETNKPGYHMTTMKIAAPDRQAYIPSPIVELLRSGIPVEDGCNAEEDFVRMGVPSSPSSLLHCVLLALKDPHYMSLSVENREAYVADCRRLIGTTTSPHLYRQELYDTDPAEITAKIMDPTVFLDPYLFYRGLEEYFRINIFVFNPSGPIHPIPGIHDPSSMGPMVEVPRAKMTHIRVPRNKRNTIIILKHFGSDTGSARYPQCELIVSRGKIVSRAPGTGTGLVLPADDDQSDVDDEDESPALRPSPVLVVQSEVGGYGSALVVSTKGASVFGEDMSEQLYGVVNSSLRGYIWSFPRPGIARVSTKPSESLQVRDDPYSKTNWERALRPRGTLLAQHVDAYGKLRILQVQFEETIVSICVPPSQPLNLPSLSGITTVTEEQARSIFGEPSGITRAGLWFPIVDYPCGLFVPAHVISLETDDAPPPPVGEYRFDSSLSDIRDPIVEIRTVKRYTNVLIQLIRWLWRQSRMPIREWLASYVHNDTDPSLKTNGRPTMPESIPRRLPKVGPDGVLGSLDRIKDWWPEYFRTDGVHLYPELYDRVIGYFVREDVLTDGLPPKDKFMALQTHIDGLYTLDSDFIQVPKSVIFTDTEHMTNWLAHHALRGKGMIGTSQSINPIMEKLDSGLAFEMEPFIYRDMSTSKMYLIQNVKGGELSRCVNVCLYWYYEGINGGSKTLPYPGTVDSVPHVTYAISTSQVLVPVLDKSQKNVPYVQVLRYTKDRYAAMLPIL